MRAICVDDEPLAVEYTVGQCALLPEIGEAKGFTDARQKYAPSPDSPYAGVCEKSVAAMERDERNGRPPSSVSDVVLKLIGRKSPPVRVAVGFPFKALMFIKRLLPDRLARFILTKLYLG